MMTTMIRVAQPRGVVASSASARDGRANARARASRRCAVRAGVGRGRPRASRARIVAEAASDGDGDGAREASASVDVWAKAKRATKIGAVVAFVLLTVPKAASAVEPRARGGASSSATTRAKTAAAVLGEIAEAEAGGGDVGVDDSDAMTTGGGSDDVMDVGGDPFDDVDDEGAVEGPPKKTRRRRRGTVAKKKLDLDEVGTPKKKKKKKGSRGKRAAKAALERVQYKTGEHPESKRAQLSKLEQQLAAQASEYAEFEGEKKSKNPFTKIFSKRGDRFVRNINLAYLRDPYAMMGTDRFPTETSYTAFHKLVDVGRVNRVVYRANETSIRYYIDDTEEVFGCNLPYDPTLYKKLLQERPGCAGFISIEMEKYPSWLNATAFAFNMLTPLVIVFYAWAIYEGTFKDSSEDMFGNMTTRQYDSTVRQGMSLADISGIDTVKEEMLELISYLKDFEKYNSMGARIPAGVLLCGPPGTGKTLLARCVAGEAGVPFFSCAGTEFMEMFVGVGAARIRNLFDQAKKVAPCIIFIDEFDAVGTKRSETQSGQVYGNDEATATINQMLTEMDGFSTATGIMVLAATNRPQVLDPALIRAGRFDRVIEMGLPNKKSREEILFLHCNKPALKGNVDPNLDYEYVARQSAGFSGADIENLTKSAVMRVAQAERGLASTGDFLWCIDDIRRSQSFVRNGSGAGSLSRDTMLEDALVAQLNPYVRDTVASYYAAQTVVAMQMPAFDELSKVTLFQGGKATGQISYVPDEVDSPAARSVRSQSYYESKLCVLVAGQMAERYLYGPEHVSTAGTEDIASATKLACDMVMRHGWSELGPIALAAESTREEDYLRVGKESQIDLIAQMSEEMNLLVYNEVRKTLVRACQRAVMTLHEPKNREMLFTLRESLLTARELTGRQLTNAFDKAGIERERTMEVWDLAWGEQNEVYWDDLMLSVWSSEPESGRFWELVKDQMHAVGETDASTGLPPLPDWASNYLGQMTDQERVNIAITLPDEAASKFLAQSGGVPSEYTEKRARAASLKADADRAVEDARRAAEARGDA